MDAQGNHAYNGDTLATIISRIIDGGGDPYASTTKWVRFYEDGEVDHDIQYEFVHHFIKNDVEWAIEQEKHKRAMSKYEAKMAQYEKDMATYEARLAEWEKAVAEKKEREERAIYLKLKNKYGDS